MLRPWGDHQIAALHGQPSGAVRQRLRHKGRLCIGGAAENPAVKRRVEEVLALFDEIAGVDSFDFVNMAQVAAARRNLLFAFRGYGKGGQALFQALRVRRSALAKAQAVPAYVILPDRSLLDMARRKPATAAEMAGIHGVGEAKLARYGEAFLEVIRGHRGG